MKKFAIFCVICVAAFSAWYGITLGDDGLIRGTGREAVVTVHPLGQTDTEVMQDVKQAGAVFPQLMEEKFQLKLQRDTEIWLAADTANAKGLMLQRMPAQLDEKGAAITDSKDDEDHWHHLVALASTLTANEMLATDIETLQHRLFWEEDMTAFDALHPVFHCSCSREKVGNMLKMLGHAEVNQALKEQGALTINCDYCGKSYTFDSIDCNALFSPIITSDPPSGTRH